MSKSRIFKTARITPKELAKIAADINDGAVAVFPTDTVYGIGTNAFNEESIRRIYEIKNRPAAVPLQILVGSVPLAQEIVLWNESAEKLAAAFWPGALTMILTPNEKGRALRRGFAGLGLRVPGNPFLVGLLETMRAPLASTSANLHEMDVITTEKELLKTFENKADIILLGGTLSPVASTVLNMTESPVMVREAAITWEELEAVLKKH